MEWHAIPWDEILVSTHAAQVIVRGTLTYFGLLILLKLVLKRQMGNLAANDILVIVLISDASQNGMAGEYRSVTDGILLVATIVGWDFAIDWLSFRWKLLARILNPPPVPLVQKGRLNRRNMRRELITEAELWTVLRKNDVSELAQVKAAYVESDGEVSVIKQG